MPRTGLALVADALGPLAGTLPRGGVVLVCLLLTLAASRCAAWAIQGNRPLLLLGSWATGMAGFVAGCVAFQAFASGSAGPVGLPTLAAFVGAHGLPLASLLLLGSVTAAGIELTRGWAGTAARLPGTGPRRSRVEAVGSLGEALVAAELRGLGWPHLANVVLTGRGWSAEIDHLVRAPDGIVVIETKTWSGLVSGQPDGEHWLQHSGGRVRALLNPLAQNAAHMDAVRAVIGDAGVSLRGLVVSAGHARFAPPLAGRVVPLRGLAGVLRESAASPSWGQGGIDAAWAALTAEAAASDGRRAAHVERVDSRKRGRR